MIDREQAIQAAQEAAAAHCWMAPNDVLPFIVDAILALPDPRNAGVAAAREVVDKQHLFGLAHSGAAEAMKDLRAALAALDGER